MRAATSRVIRTPDEWQEHLQAWRRSGMKLTAYAQAHQLNVKSFGNAKRRLNGSRGKAVGRASSVFNWVVVSSSPSLGGYHVSFPERLVIECNRGGDLGEFSCFIQRQRTPH